MTDKQKYIGIALLLLGVVLIMLFTIIALKNTDFSNYRNLI
jgi:hypothetical protein